LETSRWTDAEAGPQQEVAMETKKFIDVFCAQCCLCADHKEKDFTAAFCVMAFDNGQEIFVEDTFPKLLVHSANVGCGKVNKFQVGHLQDAFCKTRVCYDGNLAFTQSCNEQTSCLKMMRAQMGKSKKKKHHRRNPENYSRRQFIDVVCSQCGICEEENASHCFDIFYRKNPRLFLDRVFLDLIKIREENLKINIKPDNITMADFVEIFCDSQICYKTLKECSLCTKTNDCYDVFQDQICNITDISSKPVKIKKKKKLKTSYVCAPYASFFSSGSAAFKKEIKRILNGDNPIEQNKSEELSVPDPAESNAGTAD
jgi:hypothetical protein